MLIYCSIITDKSATIFSHPIDHPFVPTGNQHSLIFHAHQTIKGTAPNTLIETILNRCGSQYHTCPTCQAHRTQPPPHPPSPSALSSFIAQRETGLAAQTKHPTFFCKLLRVLLLRSITNPKHLCSEWRGVVLLWRKVDGSFARVTRPSFSSLTLSVLASHWRVVGFDEATRVRYAMFATKLLPNLKYIYKWGWAREPFSLSLSVHHRRLRIT